MTDFFTQEQLAQKAFTTSGIPLETTQDISGIKPITKDKTSAFGGTVKSTVYNLKYLKGTDTPIHKACRGFHSALTKELDYEVILMIGQTQVRAKDLTAITEISFKVSFDHGACKAYVYPILGFT